MKVLYPSKSNCASNKRMDYSSYTHKLCSKCKNIKEVNDFQKEMKSTKTGWRYRSHCKSCINVATRIRDNKKRRANGIKKRKRMPLEQMKEHRRASSRKHYWANLQKERERSNKWRKENPEKQRAIEIRRYERKKNAEGSHTNEEWQNLKKSYGEMCVYCQRCEPEVKIIGDHIIPLSKGGTKYIENIQPLCMSCNSSKQDKIIERSETYLLRFENE